MSALGTDNFPLFIPECEQGIGQVILAPDSAKLIDGVKILPIRFGLTIADIFSRFFGSATA